MNPCKIKHLPTGLFFKPRSVHSISNLSPQGKIYTSEGRAKSAIANCHPVASRDLKGHPDKIKTSWKGKIKIFGKNGEVIFCKKEDFEIITAEKSFKLMLEEIKSKGIKEGDFFKIKTIDLEEIINTKINGILT